MKPYDKGLDKSVIKQISEFLFSKFKEKNEEKDGENKFLDTRTRIKGKEMFNALTFYRLLEEQYNCKPAGEVADILERLAISDNGEGRLEAFHILKGKTPTEEKMLTGIAEILKNASEET